MAIIIPNIRLGLGASRQDAIAAALRMLGVSSAAVTRAYIAKYSVDARNKERIRMVYSVGIQLEGEQRFARNIKACGGVIRTFFEPEFCPAGPPMSHPPVVVGFGPAGMFCALALARMGYRPLVLERGKAIDGRVQTVNRFWASGALDTHTNVQFGEGGAGAFSDGKLTTRIGDERCDYILRELHLHGAPDDILEKAKPHIGTDRLRGVVKSIRSEIIALGGQVLFEHEVQAITVKNGAIASVRVNGAEVPCEILTLCIGHSARDTIGMLHGLGVPMQGKAFSVGVRIEHPQREIDSSLYGKFAGHPALPPGEYQLSHRKNGRGVYTFCMCPGGFVVPAASEEGGVVTNGMSEYARNAENANAALVVGVGPEDFGTGALDGIQFQRTLERRAFAMGGGNYRAPAQTAGRFLAGQGGIEPGGVAPSYALGVTQADMGELFPSYVTDMLRDGLSCFSSKVKAFGLRGAVLTGVETRTSSPVRILRGEALQSEAVAGLYPCGEGAGYAGGIMSAAVDGLRVAQAIMAFRTAPR